jgi:Domain of unknown function (DUF4267)
MSSHTSAEQSTAPSCKLQRNPTFNLSLPLWIIHDQLLANLPYSRIILQGLDMDSLLTQTQRLVAANSGILLLVFRTTATLTGLVLVSAGVTGLISPRKLAEQFGTPLKPAPASPDNKRGSKNALKSGGDQEFTKAWITACAGRELFLGSLILSLNYLKEYRALGVALTVGNVVGVADTVASLRGGVKGAYRMHLIPTILLAWMGPLGLLLSGAA